MKALADQKFALDHSAIVAQTDERGIINMVNDKFCEISGYSRDELLGRDHRVVNSGYHPKSYFQDLWRTISKGNVWKGEICNRKKTGELYWVMTTITPFINDDGRPYQYLAVRQDITELKHAQKVILEQQVQLVNASRLSAIGEIAAAITHEINNPLAVILGRAEMLQELSMTSDLDRDHLKRVADSILVTGKRIEKIVRGMKTLAHKGDESEPFVKFRVRDIISDSLELCGYRFKEQNVRILQSPIPDDLVISCRSHEIVQIVVNLINNAFDAISALEEKWIDLQVRSREDFVEIVISDSGEGITSQIQEKLFYPFFSTKKVQYGTGLGLSISQSLAEGHRGKLFYDSSRKNTTFVLELPYLPK